MPFYSREVHMKIHTAFVLLAVTAAISCSKPMEEKKLIYPTAKKAAPGR